MNQDILNAASAKIAELTDIRCKISGTQTNGTNSPVSPQIVLSYKDFTIAYPVEVKQKVVPSQIPNIVNRTKNMGPLIVVADYITPQAKELLRTNDISYADTAGNMFLKAGYLYIYIQTNQTNRKKLKVHARAFTKAGLKVVYQFLVHPESLNKPYRYIGEHAKVTIATVGAVLKDLLKEQYIIRENGKTYRFVDRVKLFEEWVRAYNRVLRPKLKTRRFKWLNENQNWRTVQLPDKTYWGGGNAAEQMTDYLIADKTEIYTGLRFEEVMKALKIVPDTQGELTLTEIFWADLPGNINRVHPILVYADLLNESNPRYLETANLVYKNYIQDGL
jgi:hypothetical protein